MKESVGYTVSFNIMIIFITVIITFLCAALIYFKSNKASNIIQTAIEKYEGYYEGPDAAKELRYRPAIEEINRNLSSIGYGSRTISCDPNVDDSNDSDGRCDLVSDDNENSYCVYVCEEDLDYYYFKIRTNMMINVPIINNILDIPIFSNTNRLYDFEDVIH